MTTAHTIPIYGVQQPLDVKAKLWNRIEWPTTEEEEAAAGGGPIAVTVKTTDGASQEVECPFSTGLGSVLYTAVADALGADRDKIRLIVLRATVDPRKSLARAGVEAGAVVRCLAEELW